MSVAPDVTLVGKLGNVVGNAGTTPTTQLDIGSIDIALCGYGPQTPRVAGEAILSHVTQNVAVSPTTGMFDVVLFSNGLIQPTGTYYTITTRNSNGDIVQVEAYFLEPGAWDLSNMQPYDPGQPPPPLPPLIIPQLDIVPFSAEPVFDGTNFTAFQITLTGNVILAEIQNMVPGNLYTFIILQTGNHTFGWPLNVYNATFISPLANTYTIQTFVALDNGSLYAIGPGTHYTL